MTKQAKLLTALKSGEVLTTKQIKARYGLVNPQSAIKELREAGECIYGNEVKNSKGVKVMKYRLGKPSRAMVRAAARLAGSHFFSR